MPGPTMHDADVDDPRRHDEPSAVKEVIVTILAALVLAYLVQGFLVKPFRIPSGSMENTLHCGDRVLVNRLAYRFGDPERGDVVVFHPPAGLTEEGKPDPSTVAGEDGALPLRQANGEVTEHPADLNYIKRIIGLPGDTVEVRDHRAIVNGEQIEEPYLHPLAEGELSSSGQLEPFKVPEGTYFMMGDHRDNSQDSRVFGAIPRSFVIGEAFMVYWPPRRIGGLPDRDPGGPAASTPDPNCIETIPQDIGGG